MAGPPATIGMWIMLLPDIILNNSPAIRGSGPADAILTLVGLALARAMNLGTVPAGRESGPA